MGEFYLTNRAMRDLEQIFDYSHKSWGKQQATLYMKALYQGFQRIAEHPLSSPAQQRRVTPFAMEKIEKHMAIYTIKDQKTIIITVLHGSRDIEQILEKIRSEFL